MSNGELSHNKTETSASDAASIHGYTWASDISSTQAMNVLINRTGSVYKLWFVKDGATADFKAPMSVSTNSGSEIKVVSTVDSSSCTTSFTTVAAAFQLTVPVMRLMADCESLSVA